MQGQQDRDPPESNDAASSSGRQVMQTGTSSSSAQQDSTPGTVGNDPDPSVSGSGRETSTSRRFYKFVRALIQGRRDHNNQVLRHQPSSSKNQEHIRENLEEVAGSRLLNTTINSKSPKDKFRSNINALENPNDRDAADARCTALSHDQYLYNKREDQDLDLDHSQYKLDSYCESDISTITNSQEDFKTALNQSIHLQESFESSEIERLNEAYAIETACKSRTIYEPSELQQENVALYGTKSQIPQRDIHYGGGQAQQDQRQRTVLRNNSVTEEGSPKSSLFAISIPRLHRNNILDPAEEEYQIEAHQNSPEQLNSPPSESILTAVIREVREHIRLPELLASLSNNAYDPPSHNAEDFTLAPTHQPGDSDDEQFYPARTQLRRPESSVDPRVNDATDDDVSLIDDLTVDLDISESEERDLGLISHHLSRAIRQAVSNGIGLAPGTSYTASPPSLAVLATSAASAVSNILATAPGLDSHLAPTRRITSRSNISGPLYYGPTIAGFASSIIGHIVQSPTVGSTTNEDDRSVHQNRSTTEFSSANRRRRLRTTPAIPPATARQTSQTVSQPLVAQAGRAYPGGYAQRSAAFTFPAPETRPNPPPATLFTRIGPIPAPLLIQVRATRTQQQQQRRTLSPHRPDLRDRAHQGIHQEDQQEEQDQEEEGDDQSYPPNNNAQRYNTIQHRNNNENTIHPSVALVDRQVEIDLPPPPPPPPPPPVPPVIHAHRRHQILQTQTTEIGGQQLRVYPRMLHPPPSVPGAQRRHSAQVRKPSSIQR